MSVTWGVLSTLGFGSGVWAAGLMTTVSSYWGVHAAWVEFVDRAEVRLVDCSLPEEVRCALVLERRYAGAEIVGVGSEATGKGLGDDRLGVTGGGVDVLLVDLLGNGSRMQNVADQLGDMLLEFLGRCDAGE